MAGQRFRTQQMIHELRDTEWSEPRAMRSRRSAMDGTEPAGVGSREVWAHHHSFGFDERLIDTGITRRRACKDLR